MLLSVVDWIIVIAFYMESRNLQLVMNASARLIYRAHKFCHITPLLAELHWLPVCSRIHYKILLITGHLSDLISIQQPSTYNLRRNDNGRLLERPSAKTKKTMRDRAFQVAAPILWNKLPRSAREATNLTDRWRNHRNFVPHGIPRTLNMRYSPR